MTTAQARAVPFVFANLRNALMATAAVGSLIALAPAANAACVGDGTPNTCTLVIGAAGANQEDITGAGTVDAGGDADTLAFSGVGMVLNANTIGTGDTFTAPLRFLDFELANVTAGSDLTLTGAAAASTQSLTWTIDGTLNTLGGNAIGDASAVTVSAGGLLDLGVVSETIGSLAGAGNVNVGAAAILTAGGNGGNTTYSGVISGAGGFTKAGGSKMILSGVNTFAGPLAVTGGVLEVGNANAIAAASGVTISGGTLSSQGAFANYTITGPVTITTTNQLSRLTGNAIINGKVETNGGLQPGHTSVPTWPTGTTAENPGQDMGQITIIGDYEAKGAFAYVGMFVDIDASAPAGGIAGTDKDFLTIDGNVLGTIATKFSVASFDQVPVGAATTGNGIQVIRITGASANAGNEFYQGNGLVAGPYQYLLRYVANYSGSDDGYFLQSAARDETYAHAALLSAGQSLIRSCYRDDQRIPDSPKGATYGRAWFGYRQGSNSFGADTGVEQDQDFSCTTGGMDWRMGNGWFGGVSGGFGSSSGDLVAVSGNAKLDGDARVIEAYAAFTSSNFFLNLSGGYADMDWTYIGQLNANAASSSGFIGSVQAGVGLGLEPIAVKLIGMINYDGVNCGETCFGYTVTEDTGLIEAKGALRFDGVTWGGSVRPWAQVGYSTILSDGVNSVTGGAYTVVSDTNDQLLTIEAGLQSYLDENLALFFDGGYNESLSKDISGYRAGIGAKLYW